MELDVALKCYAFHLPRCASATKGYVTTKLEMSMAWPWGWWWWQWVTVAVHIMTVFVTCWAVWNHTISLLSNSMWHCGFTEREGGNFLSNSDCVYICYLQLPYMIKVWQRVNWKYFSNSYQCLMNGSHFGWSRWSFCTADIPVLSCCRIPKTGIWV